VRIGALEWMGAPTTVLTSGMTVSPPPPDYESPADLALFCLARIQKIAQAGPRHLLPLPEEITAIEVISKFMYIMGIMCNTHNCNHFTSIYALYIITINKLYVTILIEKNINSSYEWVLK
jgi:hypothetical protein